MRRTNLHTNRVSTKVENVAVYLEDKSATVSGTLRTCDMELTWEHGIFYARLEWCYLTAATAICTDEQRIVHLRFLPLA